MKVAAFWKVTSPTSWIFKVNVVFIFASHFRYILESFHAVRTQLQIEKIIAIPVGNLVKRFTNSLIDKLQLLKLFN